MRALQTQHFANTNWINCNGARSRAHSSAHDARIMWSYKVLAVRPRPLTEWHCAVGRAHGMWTEVHVSGEPEALWAHNRALTQVLFILCNSQAHTFARTHANIYLACVHASVRPQSFFVTRCRWARYFGTREYCVICNSLDIRNSVYATYVVLCGQVWMQLVGEEWGVVMRI